MISESIITRTIDILKDNPLIDILDATKEAIKEEQKLINEIIDQRTERSQKALVIFRKNTYSIIHAIN